MKSVLSLVSAHAYCILHACINMHACMLECSWRTKEWRAYFNLFLLNMKAWSNLSVCWVIGAQRSINFYEFSVIKNHVLYESFQRLAFVGQYLHELCMCNQRWKSEVEEEIYDVALSSLFQFKILLLFNWIEWFFSITVEEVYGKLLGNLFN